MSGINQEDLVLKLRQARETAQTKRKEKPQNNQRFRYQKCLHDAVHDVYRNAGIPILTQYFSVHDEDLHIELWDVKKLMCGGDVQQAKMFVEKQVIPFCNNEFTLST